MKMLPPIRPREILPLYDHWVELGGVRHRITLRWRPRPGGWYLRLRNAANELLVDGQRLVVGSPLLWRHRLPLGGYLYLVDVSGSGEECGLEDLGHRCKLFFFAADEIPKPTTSNITIEVV